jgi:hypothetical protein
MQASVRLVYTENRSAVEHQIHSPNQLLAKSACRTCSASVVVNIPTT